LKNSFARAKIEATFFVSDSFVESTDLLSTSSPREMAPYFTFDDVEFGTFDDINTPLNYKNGGSIQ